MPFAVAGAAIGAIGAVSSAKTQAKASQRAADAQTAQFERQVELQEPFRQSGLAAQNRLLTLLGITPTAEAEETRERFDAAAYLRENPNVAADPFWKSDPYGHYVTHGRDEGKRFTWTADAAQQRAQPSPEFGKYARDFGMQDFQQDPGYGFRLSEGLKALDRQAAARGGLISGAALKAAGRYGQEAASQEYQNAFNRYQVNRAAQLNPLQSLAGQAQTSAGAIGQAGQQLATGLGEAYAGAANARASGYMGAANALAGGLGQYANYRQQQQMLNQMSPSYGGGGFSAYDTSGYGMGGPGYDTAAIGALPTRGGA